MSGWDIRAIYSKRFGEEFAKRFDRIENRDITPEPEQIQTPLDIELKRFLNKFQKESWEAIGRGGELIDLQPYINKLKEIGGKYANNDKPVVQHNSISRNNAVIRTDISLPEHGSNADEFNAKGRDGNS